MGGLPAIAVGVVSGLIFGPMIGLAAMKTVLGIVEHKSPPKANTAVVRALKWDYLKALNEGQASYQLMNQHLVAQKVTHQEMVFVPTAEGPGRVKVARQTIDPENRLLRGAGLEQLSDLSGSDSDDDDARQALGIG